MKPTADISVSDPKNIQPTKTGAFILGKLGQFKSTALAAVAALGLASSAEATAPVVIGGTLPTSTVSTPTLLAGTPGTITDTATSIAGASRLVISSTGTGITGTYGSRFQVTLSAGDLDTYGGTLTITGYYGRSVSSAGASVDNDLNSRFAYKIGSGSEVDLLTFDGPRSLNDTTASPLTTPIGDNNNYSFSKEITIGPGAQTIDFTNYATLENIRNGNVRIYGDPNATQGLVFTYTKNTDTNANSIIDAWEIAHFKSLLEPSNGDPDNDGQTNLLEYALNTDPKKSNPSSTISAIEDINGQKYLTLSFVRNPLATNLTYTVEGSNDLQLWGKVLEVVNTTQTKVTDIVPVSSTPTRFLRLKIEPK